MMNSNMQSFPDRIREELYNAVEYARKEQTDYQEQNILFGHNPVDFSRSRILDFNTIVNFLIYMHLLELLLALLLLKLIKQNLLQLI